MLRNRACAAVDDSAGGVVGSGQLKFSQAMPFYLVGLGR
jgi:hypothetical protein